MAHSIKRIFISSTSRDLSLYRECVRDVLLRLGAFPIIMEAFNSTEDNALQLCYDKLQEADIFIGIYAHRYGYAPSSEVSYRTDSGGVGVGDSQTSITHWEYLWAVERGLPILLFVLSEHDSSARPVVWPPEYIEDEPNKTRIREFKQLVMSKHVVGFFHSPDHLAAQVATGLAGMLGKSTPASGQRIKTYELLNMIGEGAFGRVYRAQQASVKRDVAIKVVRPEHVNKPEFIRNFEAEAQIVARLEHPHIVPLFDYWRDGGGAYLVMRYMSAGSLTARLDGTALPLDRVLRWMDQISDALTFAHQHGVIHRDLKPDNVLLDAGDNAYLADFGIARKTEAVPVEEGITGTMAYIAPDQLRGHSPTPQSDIYSLGVMLYELLTGSHPFGRQSPVQFAMSHLNERIPALGEKRPDLPSRMNDVIQRATAKEVTERYNTARELAADLRLALNVNTTAPVSTQIDLTGLKHQALTLTNPYKGLRAFQEYDAEEFFGREALIQQLVTRLCEPDADSRFLVVIGPSGSGKSSVVKAGLLPALRRGGVPASNRWFITEMLPSAHPFDELEAALLRVAINPPATLLEQLKADERGLSRALKRLLPADPEIELLLVIDQFEELFTLTTNEAERVLFLNNLMGALEDPHPRLRLILTMRADFYDKPLHYLAFGSLFKKRLETVMPLSPQELERAIVQPAEKLGLVFEPGLVLAIAHDIGEQPGILPLLQYALTQLFEKREGLVLTLAAYHEMGGVAGALGGQAETLFEGLTLVEQDVVRHIFLRLITLGEGTEDTRRRVWQSELRAEAGPLLQRYGAARLLTFDHDPSTRQPTVEVAHEALLRTWTRLKGWISSARDDMRMQRRLSQAAREWLEASEDSGFLAREALLEQFEYWSKSTTLPLNELERRFLENSLFERSQRQLMDEARKAHEAQTARRAQMLGRAAAAFAVVGLIAVGATMGAVRQSLTAQEQAQTATVAQGEARTEGQTAIARESSANTQVAMAAQTLTPIPATLTFVAEQVNSAQKFAEALQLAARGQDVYDNGDQPLGLALALYASQIDSSPQVQQILSKLAYQPGAQRRFEGHNESATSLALSPDGDTVLSGSLDGTLILWNLATGEIIRRFEGQADWINSVAFNPDRQTVASGAYNGSLFLWDVNTAAIVQRFEGVTAPIGSIQFSPNGQFLLSGSHDGAVLLWEVATGSVVQRFEGHTTAVYAVAISPDGKRVIAGAEDGSVIVWDQATGDIRHILKENDRPVRSVAFSPDSRRAVSGADNSAIILWDLDIGTSVRYFDGHSALVSSLAFRADGELLLSGSADGTLILWSVETAGIRRRLQGHAASVNAVAFTPDGEQVVSASKDRTLMLWDVSGVDPLTTTTASIARRFEGNNGYVTGVAFSPDGRFLLSGSQDQTLRLWDVTAGTIVRRFEGHSDLVRTVAFSADGQLIVSGGFDNLVMLWDATSGRRIRQFEGHARAVISVAFSPDGRFVLSGSDDMVMMLWETETGRLVHTFEGHTGGIKSVTFNSNGKWALSASDDQTLMLWDVVSGEMLRRFEGHNASASSAVFSSDDRFVLSGSYDNTLILWETETGTAMRQFTGHSGPIRSVAFSADGRLAVSGSDDNTMILWDVVTGTLLQHFEGHISNLNSVAFSPDGQFVVSGSSDKAMILWRNDTFEQLRVWVTENRYMPTLSCEQHLSYGFQSSCDEGRLTGD